MLEGWEEFVDIRKYWGSFTMTDEALGYCHGMHVAQPLRVESDRESGTHIVRFDLIELHKYIKFICEHCGVTENIDGTMTTFDGIVVPIKFREPPLQITKASNKK